MTYKRPREPTNKKRMLNKMMRHTKEGIMRYEHEKYLELYIHEDKTITERTTIFVLFNTILFTLFIPMVANSDYASLLFSMLISLAAVVIGIFQIFIIIRATIARNIWRHEFREIGKKIDIDIDTDIAKNFLVGLPFSKSINAQQTVNSFDVSLNFIITILWYVSLTLSAAKFYLEVIENPYILVVFIIIWLIFAYAIIKIFISAIKTLDIVDRIH